VASRAAQLAAAAASTAPEAAWCFVALTGDVAFSGRDDEYEIAAEFLKELQDQLRSRLPDSECEMLIVPGNHDCDFSEPNKAREIVVSNVRADDLDETVFRQAVEVQEGFEHFAARLGAPLDKCDASGKLCRYQRYSLGADTAVEFRLVNSAWMSTPNEKQGSLLFPTQLLESPERDGPLPNLVVTLLHHPYNWFESSNARALRTELEATSDIVLTGHEHEIDEYLKDRRLGQQIDYVEGGVLQGLATARSSEFNVLVVDLHDKEQTLYRFSWNDHSGRYEPAADPISTSLARNLYRLRQEFRLTEAFQAFLSDPGAKFTHPDKEIIHLDDIFVYPDLLELKLPGEDEWPRSVVRDEPPAFIVERRRVLLLGPDWCGKTALAKALFEDLRRNGLVPVYVSGTELRGYSPPQVRLAIEHAFCTAYESPDVNAFRQLEQAQKACIVDDFHKGPPSARARNIVIDTLESMFGVIVLLGNEALRFGDVVSHDGEQDLPLWDYTQCAILPLGHVLRSDIIRKWTYLGRTLTHSETELERRAVQAQDIISLLMGQNFIPSYPLFVVFLLQQMEAGRPLATMATSGSFAFLYESLLTMALARSSRLELDLDTQYGYLSEFAHFLFRRRARSASTIDTIDWHSRHCQEYGIRLDFERLMHDLSEAHVLSTVDNSVSFRYPYMYYYFVARYLSEHMDDDATREHVTSMSKRLHHEESANILMFLTYLSKDPFILSSILDSSRSLFSSHPECDLAEKTEFLERLVSTVPVLALDSTSPIQRRRKLLATRDQLEEIEAAEDVEAEDVEAEVEEESPDLHEELEQHLQINVAFKTIQILGQVLRNFPGSLRGQRKLEVARECYSLGLRALRFILDSMESHHQDLVTYIAEFLKARNPDWSDETVGRHATFFVYNFVDGFTFVVVKQVSDSVGHEALSITYRDLLATSDTISYRFIDLSVQLDHFSGFPRKALFELHSRVRNNPFATQFLRHLVWYYFYIYPSTDRLRQSVCKKLGIVLLPGVQEPRVKRPTRP